MSDTLSGQQTLPPELDPRGGKPRRTTPWTAPRKFLAGRTLGQRIAGWTALVTAVAVLLTAGGLYAIYHDLLGKVTHVNAFDALAKNGVPRPAADAKAQTFLLIGSDTRAGTDAVYNAAKGSAEYTTGQRSDTMMLVHVPSSAAKVSIVSFPRDSWVTIPRWTDDKGAHHPVHQGKLNSAFSEGGSGLVVATLEKLSGVRVDHIVQVDFTGFKNMVNALGGVDVCVRTTRNDHDSGDQLTAGPTHHINGDQALAFVRDRKGLAGGDIDRIADQQYFLSVVLHKVLSAGTLTNPPKLLKFASAAARSMTTDPGFGVKAMSTLATRLHSIDPQHVTFLQLPILNSSAREADRQSAVELDMANLPAVFGAMKENEGQPAVSATSAAPTPAPVKLTVPPSQIRLRVSNGSGRAHLATDTSKALSRQGFTAFTAGNAAKTATSVVYYGPGKAASARTVAAAVPGALIKPKATLTRTLELVIGSNFTAVAPVTAGPVHPAPVKPAGGAAAAITPLPDTGAAGAAGAAAKPAPKAQTAAAASCAP